ncbi:leucine-rich repeat domain-containing protein [Leucobacter sp. G161]|uniref:leucine-rich repeat domain-containing protein n=1 Tax=Leucobacter sp. G161 TaxID=663704 RepID=UPI00073C5EF7|nr:leucine-rich repeat domain-containing protein [Leucobacter sp. G161]KUF06542.1 hypothetical protein AUL38_12820 [Leucobacter sp. G161]
MLNIQSRRNPVAILIGALFTLALALGMVTLPSGPAHAAEMTENAGDFRYRFDPTAPEAGAVVDYYYGQRAVDVVIPAEVQLRGKNYAVTGIGKDAFFYAPITAITIPDGVTFIGERAFGNTGFAEVVIPDSVTSIGDSAFAESKLETMTWPKNVTVIGDETFSRSPLRSIDIPEGVTSIGDAAFSSTKLTTVKLPSSLTSMGTRAFAYTLLTSVELSPNLTAIANQAFSQAPLESVVIPEGVTSIGTMAFFQSKYQGSISGTPTGLQSVTLPSTLTHLGDDSLLGGRLTAIDFPAGLVYIGSGALNGNQLQDVTIPASVTVIGSGAFTENPSLAGITLEGDAPEIAQAGRGESFPSDTATLHFLCVYDNYNKAEWQGYDLSSECEVTFDYQYDGKVSTVVTDYRHLLERV